MIYTYRNFLDHKIHRTRTRRFVGWTQPTGLLKARYAIFRSPASNDLLVPEYLLTRETKTAIANY